MVGLREFKKRFIEKFNRFKKHPYFGFVIIAALMLFVQFIRILGVDVPVATLRALGSTMIYTIVALGFSILLGYGGLASLGTAGFVGLGAYALIYLTNFLSLPIYISIILIFAGAIIIGTIVGFISLRIEGMYLAIITLGLSEILNEIFKNAVTITGGTNGSGIDGIILFNIPVVVDENIIFAFIAIIMLAIMIMTLNLMKSPTGRALLAMRNSESAAQAMGVSIFKHRLLAFIVSTVYAMLGGILYITYWPRTIPDTWSLAFSLNILAAVIVGGSQSIYGIILGTFMIFGLNMAILKNIPFFVTYPDFNLVFSGLLIIIVIMFYPGGLIKLINNLIYKIKKKIIQNKQKRREYRYGADPEQN